MNKILIICPFTSPNQGGVESHIQKLVKFIGKKGREVIIFSYQPLTTPVKAAGYEKIDNYEIYRMPWFGNGWFPKIEHNFVLTFMYLVPGLLALSLYKGWQRRGEYGVIHAHGFAAGLSGIFLKWLTGIKLVLSTHAIYDLHNRPILAGILKIILSQCDSILAVGEPSKQEIIRLGIPADRVAVHPNWVDTEFFKPRAHKIKRSIDQEINETSKQNNKKTLNKNLLETLKPGNLETNLPITILFVGRGLEKKGIFVFGELAKLNPQIRFVARVGDGPDLLRFVEECQKISNLEIRSQLPSNFEEKMNILKSEYQEADILVMPSLYEEGFAAVVLEAASSGLAIISSNLGCLPDMLDGSGAILLDPTVENFHQNLQKLISKPKILRRSQDRMRKFAIKNFSDVNAKVIFASYLLF